MMAMQIQSIDLNEVVVTGIGIISPVGNCLEEVIDGIKKSKSGIGPITQLDTSGLGVNIAGEVKDFNPDDFMINCKKSEMRRLDRVSQLAIAASKLAAEDAGLEFPLGEKCGVIIGSVAGGANSHEKGFSDLQLYGKTNPFCIPNSITNMPSANVGIALDANGINFGVNTACATGSHAIGIAYERLRFQNAYLPQHRMNYMLAGATDSCITKLGIGGFKAMRTLCSDYVRPFDLNRSGFAVSEGSVVLLLETLQHALARGAKIYAIIAGFGSNSDGYNLTSPHPDGIFGAKCMQMAMENSNISPYEIGYINAHACGTKIGDLAETKGIKTAFGELAYKIAISSSKSLTGHMMGAAGAMESVYCIIAVKYGLIVPTINYETPDPECDLDYVPNVYREKNITYTMNNSFGFGGQNAVLLFKKYQPPVHR